ncbi:NAD(+) synthase [Oceanobacillus piezotolerans]|uniref:NH(3)-dependent NAD(+) synthetase n=1 Tax=Oceanobacillus piezotolerans TaxID=2448030 RepID=A0A498DA42_9BACI|nr:NAD(+) synthase [Oceanobacillus piezotolerans]RLL47974.1 NAD(+) synthase [Oceanobacillus piezotolerans]
MEKEVNEIVQWLQQQLKVTGAKGFVVGVSGGLDSAVVANLIKQAAPENSLGVLLPIHSSEDSLEDGKKVIDECGIDSLTLDLSETHHVMYSHIKNQLQEKSEFNESSDQLAGANLRARLRMSALYTLATNYNYLVVGTDNAAEWYTGYFTKYGDGGVDILPLCEFTKSEVREMARFLDVPESVITKAPSADLWENQTDEQEMGTTYDTIDAYLKGEEIPAEDKEIIESLHKRSEHKRSSLPRFKRSR